MGDDVSKKILLTVAIDRTMRKDVSAIAQAPSLPAQVCVVPSSSGTYQLHLYLFALKNCNF